MLAVVALISAVAYMLLLLLLMFVAVDCFPVSGICCNGHVHTGSSVGFRRKLPCKWTLVHSRVIIICPDAIA